MDLDSVRYVVSLAEELHFGRAAQRHYIVPQAFGRRIQRLEGGPLGATEARVAAGRPAVPLRPRHEEAGR